MQALINAAAAAAAVAAAALISSIHSCFATIPSPPPSPPSPPPGHSYHPSPQTVPPSPTVRTTPDPTPLTPLLCLRQPSPPNCVLAPLQATPKMEVATVVDHRTGQTKKSNIRTSTGAFFDRGYDDVITRIEKCIAQVTMIPVGK